MCKASACRIEQIVHNLTPRANGCAAVRGQCHPPTSDRAPRFCHIARALLPCDRRHAHRPRPNQPHQRRHRRATPHGSSMRSRRVRRRRRSSSSRRRWRCPATASAISSRTPDSSPPTSARCSAIAAAARGITAVVGFIDFDPVARRTKAARSGSTTRRRSFATAASSSARTRRCCRTTATSTTSGSSRRAIGATPVDVPPERRHAAAGRLDLRGHVGRVLRRQAAARSSAARARSVLLNLNASPFYPGKRHDRDAADPRAHRRLGKPIVYVNTVGAADNGKNIIPFDGESLVYDASGRLVAIGRQFAEELLLVDVGPESAAPAGARSCRRSTAIARCTTRW